MTPRQKKKLLKLGLQKYAASPRPFQPPTYSQTPFDRTYAESAFKQHGIHYNPKATDQQLYNLYVNKGTVNPRQTSWTPFQKMVGEHHGYQPPRPIQPQTAANATQPAQTKPPVTAPQPAKPNAVASAIQGATKSVIPAAAAAVAAPAAAALTQNKPAAPTPPATPAAQAAPSAQGQAARPTMTMMPQNGQTPPNAQLMKSPAAANQTPANPAAAQQQQPYTKDPAIAGSTDPRTTALPDRLKGVNPATMSDADKAQWWQSQMNAQSTANQAAAGPAGSAGPSGQAGQPAQPAATTQAPQQQQPAGQPPQQQAAQQPPAAPGQAPANPAAQQTAQQANNPAAKQQPAGQQPGVQPAQKMDAKAQDTFVADLQKLPPDQAQAKAKEGVQAHFAAQPPEVKKGLQDLSAGKTDTPEAKQFQAQVEGPVKAQYVKDEYAKQVANNPNVPPQQAGGMLSGIMDSWNKMPEPMKWMMGIGLGTGLLGAVSSMFGGGGMGMGLLGVLGLGAAGLAGAGGGMFGQGAQTAVADGMFNLGQATGMIPKVDPKDLSVLRAKDPLAALREQAGGAIGTREQVAQQLQRAQGQVSSLRQLQMLPAGMQAHFLRRMDPSMSEEDAQRAVQNAGTILQAYDNPESEVGQLRQQGENYANSTGVSGWAQENVGRHLMNAGNAVSNWWNGKQGSDMNIATKLAYQYKMTKAARCWAGYEPVPGKKPYSEDSCRPIGSKKKKQTGKERHHEKTKQGCAQG